MNSNNQVISIEESSNLQLNQGLERLRRDDVDISQINDDDIEPKQIENDTAAAQLLQNKEEQRTTKRQQQTHEQLAPVYTQMILKFLKGKKDGTYSSAEKFLNSSDSDPLTNSHYPTFRRKKKFIENEGSIPERQQNKNRVTKHRKNKDLLAPDLKKWCLEQKIENGKMKTVIYSSNNMIVF